MSNASSKKPTLQSHATSASGSNRILASLDRRQSRTHSSYINFGRRRSDRLRPVRVWAGVAVAATLIGLYLYATAYRSSHSSGPAIAAPLTTTRVISTQVAPQTASLPIVAAPIAENSDTPNTATIINVAVNEPVDTRIDTPINTHKNAAVMPGAQDAVAVAPIKATPAVALAPAQKQHPAPIKQTYVAQRVSPAPQATAPAVANATQPVNSTSSTMGSTAGSDSDVDLLVALIARARQRDPVVVTSPDIKPVAAAPAPTTRSARPCTPPAQSGCSR